MSGFTFHRLRIRWLEWRRSRQGTVIVCAACRYGTISSNVYAPWFAQRFDRVTGTVWRRCPRCKYDWDTGEGPA